MHLEGQGQHMTLDWVSRTVYIANTKSDISPSKIVQYQLDLESHSVLVSRSNNIGDIAVDPYSG